MFRDKKIKNLLISQILIIITSIRISIILKTPKEGIILMIVSLILVSTLIWIHLYQQSKKIKNLSSYMNSILNNNYSLDIRDYEEGDLSNLKNDIYKMTVKLKEQSDLSLKDKNI